MTQRPWAFMIAFIKDFIITTIVPLLIGVIANSANSRFNRPIALNLFTGNKIASAKHTHVIPPLHHLFPAPGTEGPGRSTVSAEHLTETAAFVCPGTIGPAFNVEPMSLGIGSRGRTESAMREEKRKDRRETATRRMRRIGVCECVKEARGSKDEVGLLITTRVPLLAIQDSSMDGENARISLVGIMNVGWITERSLRIKEVVGAGGKRDPFAFRGKLGKVRRNRVEHVLDGACGARLPLVKCLPRGFDSADNSLFEMSTLLLHDNDGFLEEVFLDDLLLKLGQDTLISDIPIILVSLEQEKVARQMTYGSLLAVMDMGVFLKTEMSLASSPMSLADVSRSLVTFKASFAVSFWIF